MRPSAPLLVLALSVAQVIGWATAFNALAVLARPVAADPGFGLPMALAGSSLFLAVMVVASRGLTRAFVRWGAGPLLIAGSLVAVPGLATRVLALGLAIWMLAALIALRRQMMQGRAAAARPPVMEQA